ncbi:MAG: GNAT family N-acetyltransferase [Gammaproteobacteria bacterium]|nr:GNAT family N-acetyltransferase [Gammaproteobacteria bacterium]
MSPSFDIRLADWDRDRERIRSIRETVFVVEQKVDPELEWDGEDESSLHVLAAPSGEAPVATGRLQPDGKIGRMAVLEQWRGQGLGKLLLKHLVQAAADAGHDHVYLHAQSHALPFYAAAGFVADGPEFDEAGIPHRLMRRVIAASATAARTLTTYDEYGDAVIDLFAQAQREVDLFTPDLVAAVYDRPALVEAVRNFVLGNRLSRVRILLRSTDSVVKEGRRLLELADRASTSMAFRVLNEDFQDRSDAFVTADSSVFALRRQAHTWNGVYDQSRPEIARQLAHQFNEMWEHSHADPQLRRLHI